ncbi:MAG: hypothetical protein IKN73_00185 [Alphaproteobacteria bacterium]|nr:hypothetical protein [Alphaproteobacteria bacterium]
MINYRHIPQYVRYFYYPGMWDNSGQKQHTKSIKTKNIIKENKFTKINMLIVNLTEKQRKKLFYWIYFNYKNEVILLMDNIKQKQI